MKPLPLALVLAAGTTHAIWNFILKKSSDKTAFIWLMMVASLLAYLPVLIFRSRFEFPLSALGYCATSGIMQSIYLIGMAKAYKSSDLSIIYPLSRGSAPVFIVVLAIVFLSEWPSIIGFGGILLCAVGMYVIFLPSLKASDLLAPIRSLGGRESRVGILIGLLIAGYHIVDKKGVTLASPVEYVFLQFFVNMLGLSIYTLVTRSQRAAKDEWERNKAAIVIAGMLIIGTYLLILCALRLDKASYVGTVRNISIVFSVILGSLFLGEKAGRVRLFASILIFTGILLIGWA